MCALFCDPTAAVDPTFTHLRIRTQARRESKIYIYICVCVRWERGRDRGRGVVLAFRRATIVVEAIRGEGVSRADTSRANSEQDNLRV